MTIFPMSGSETDLNEEVKKIGCDEKALSLFKRKFTTLPIKITGMKTSLANIIKQEIISCKGDAVVHAKTVSCGVPATDVLLLGTESIYQQFIRKMEYQNFPTLLELAKSLKNILEMLRNPVTQQITRNKKTIDYSKPVIMGILNITDDSFFDGGKFKDLDKALERAEEMVCQGASIIDIGGESSRPGAEPVSEKEELERVIPVIEKLASRVKAVLSVDTYKSAVARKALDAGADIVNDISGLTMDPEMAKVVKEYQAIAVIMHMKGSPKDMQKNPSYDDVTLELNLYFEERLRTILDQGIPKENLIIDPGIGFGKRLEDNINIIKQIPSLKKFGLPVLIGASRKAMVSNILGKFYKGDLKNPSDRLYGTLGVHASAFINGANIIRVHDVKEHYEMMEIIRYIKESI